jgi:hypothetical protein
MKKCAFKMFCQTQGSHSQNIFSNKLEFPFLKNLIRKHSLWRLWRLTRPVLDLDLDLDFSQKKWNVNKIKSSKLNTARGSKLPSFKVTKK